MNLHRVVLRCSLLSFSLLTLLVFSASGQVRPRVTETVDDAQRVTLKGNVHPLARAEFDRGAVADAQPMKRILLLLKRSDEQETALESTLESLQDKSSPLYHQWLTPEQFGAQFGPADADIQAVTDWLTRQGFTIEKVYSGKTVVEFSGNAGQVQKAFGTAIHTYQVNGKTYTANASDPGIPAALAPVVSGIVSLHNFPRQFYARRAGNLRQSGGKSVLEPLTTIPNPFGPGNFYGVGPGDFAKIYGTPATCGTPATKCNGAGQTIAIVGETNFNVPDVQEFRSIFGLPATFDATSIVYNGEDPGITSTDEEGEALLDTEWSGGAAPGATIKYVLSASTSASQGVDLSALYIVEHNLAAVMSESYGACETDLGTAENSFVNKLWEQASAQGITVSVSSGDSGSAGCDDPHTEQIAKHAPAVNGLASTPYNVALGGTDFDEYVNASLYWSNTNDPNTGTSALGYIPEIPWNQSCAQLGSSGCNENSQLLDIVAAGGGASTLYTRPSWQMGITGTLSSDGKRDVPDVSLFASPGFNGSGYLYCQTDSGNSCSVSTGFGGALNFGVIGGTSAAAPSFAGIMALVNQSQATAQNPAPRQGNANTILYALANKSGASCASKTPVATACIFNDIVAGSSGLPTGGKGIGTIDVPCQNGTIDCNATPASPVGVLENGVTSPIMAWNVATGYDMASGLGSVNIGNLISAWSTASSVPTTTTLTLNPASGLTHGSSTSSVTINVTAKTGTATGNVSLIALVPTQPGGTAPFGVASFTLASGKATGTTQNLPGGMSYQVYAHYSGDGMNAPSDSTPVSVTVAPESSKTFIVVPTFDPSSGRETSPNASSVSYGSLYIVRVYVTNGSGVASPSGPPSGACTQASVVACPSGTIALTANGNPVDGGTFQLNDIGYTRDLVPTLPGGTYPLAAAYSGDSSYQQSSTTESFMVTPAVTTLNNAFGNSSPLVGQQIQIGVTLNSQAYSGVAPTGTVTFFDGGTALPGPVTFTGFAPSNQNTGSAQATMTATFTNSGTHVISANYSGDSNYAAATSGPFVTFDVLNATTASINVNPTQVNYGGTITIAGAIDTTVPSSNAALKPTGGIRLLGSTDNLITSGITTSVGSDANGNWEILVNGTVKPTGTEFFSLNYIGDANYAATSVMSQFVFVNLPDFSITPTPNALTVTAGQSGSASLSIAPLTSMNSTVTFTCSTPSMVGTSCSVSPATINLANNSAATTTFTINTLGPSGGSATAAMRRQSSGVFWNWRPKTWLLAASFSATALLAFLLTLNRGRSRRWAARMASVFLFLSVFGCGGGGGSTGSGGGGGGGGGGPVATTTSIAVSANKVPAGSTPSLTLTASVTGSDTPTGTITFWENGNGGALAPTVNLVSGKASAQVALPLVGTHQIYAQYSGDTHNLGSSSSTYNVVATGTAYAQIQGVTGPLMHYSNVNIVIQ